MGDSSEVSLDDEDRGRSRKRLLPSCSARSPSPPFRNTSQLYVHPSTLACAQSCVPCAYKVGCFDVALDKEFTKVWPNQRPETCPRLRQQLQTPPQRGRHSETTKMLRITDWPCLQTNSCILTVGDGDFSYSAALTRHLGPGATNFVATSYESQANLERIYRSETLKEYWDKLKQVGSRVCFEVDATHLPKDLQDAVWDLVIWNFPCTAVASGQDGQNEAMEQNKALLRKFVSRVRAHEMHLTHKTKPPYDQWGLVDLVTSAESQHGAWMYVGRIVLDRALWQPYVPRKALDQKSFPCHDACTYVFQRVTVKPWLEKALVPVTHEDLQQLRHHWLQQQKPNKKTKQKGNRRR